MGHAENCLMGVGVKGDLRVPDGHVGACTQEATCSLESICQMPVRYHPICLEMVSMVGNP